MMVFHQIKKIAVYRYMTIFQMFKRLLKDCRNLVFCSDIEPTYLLLYRQRNLVKCTFAFGCFNFQFSFQKINP